MSIAGFLGKWEHEVKLQLSIEDFARWRAYFTMLEKTHKQ